MNFLCPPVIFHTIYCHEGSGLDTRLVQHPVSEHHDPHKHIWQPCSNGEWIVFGLVCMVKTLLVIHFHSFQTKQIWSFCGCCAEEVAIKYCITMSIYPIEGGGL